jgi:hypothetical protein
MIPLDENRFRLSGAPAEVRFESTPEGAPRLVLAFESETPVSFEPATQFVPTDQQLEEYVGTGHGAADPFPRQSLTVGRQ